MKKMLLPVLILLSMGCTTTETSKLTKEEAIQQIYNMEKAFNEMLAKEGRAVAFAHFAAEDGGINRGGKMIMGKTAIKEFYDKSTSTNVSLTWQPDKVEISDDFSMASTWGKFQYSGNRENGELFKNTGLFHTVWKRQSDGTWRYIYD